eukprot:2297445-Rhodomonas_salina.2
MAAVATTVKSVEERDPCHCGGKHGEQQRSGLHGSIYAVLCSLFVFRSDDLLHGPVQPPPVEAERELLLFVPGYVFLPPVRAV